IFDHAQYYSVCFMKPEHRKILSYFGSVSGRDENKMEKGGLHVNTEEAAPYFEESRAVVLCRVMGRSDFDPDSVDDGVRDWYRAEGVHTQYYGEIVKVLVSDTDESR
ncbi:MAG: flavin reductase, partial [Lachnospiraceae bacterium]|nr:flavin reductase [Lachnospiraceae bacterium]